jgi:N-acetylmuramoyl-L-alanine amidase
MPGISVARTLSSLRSASRSRSPGRTLAAIVVVGAVLVAGQAGFGRAASRRTVKVQRGDTLWGLSQRYGVNMNQLATTNHMKVSDVLLAGRTLTLPGTAPAPSTKASTKPSTKARAKAGAKATTTAADPRTLQRTFCSTYKPPTGARGQLPSDLRASPPRLALRPVFAKWARVYGVPLDLIEAEAWQESGWSNDAVSSAGAQGIGQIMPDTAIFLNQSLGMNLKVGVPDDNIRMMAAFLGYLLKSTGGDVCGAVASYYQGFATLQRYGVLPVSQVYVRNVLSLRPRFR